MAETTINETRICDNQPQAPQEFDFHSAHESMLALARESLKLDDAIESYIIKVCRAKDLEEYIKELRAEITRMEEDILPSRLLMMGIKKLSIQRNGVDSIEIVEDVKAKVNGADNQVYAAHSWLESTGAISPEKIKTKTVSAIHASSLKAAARKIVAEWRETAAACGGLPDDDGLAEARKHIGLYLQRKVKLNATKNEKKSKAKGGATRKKDDH